MAAIAFYLWNYLNGGHRVLERLSDHVLDRVLDRVPLSLTTLLNYNQQKSKIWNYVRHLF
jgi:hypothetical protein